MGFIIQFYIIFGTNLLTQGPVQIAIFFAYFSVSQKRNIKRSPNGMKPSGELFLERVSTQKTWSTREGTREAATRVQGAPPPSWAPYGSPDALLPPICTHIP